MGAQPRGKDKKPGPRVAREPYRLLCRRGHSGDRGIRTYRLRNKGPATRLWLHPTKRQRPLDAEIRTVGCTHNRQDADIERDFHMANRTFQDIAEPNEARPRPYVLRRSEQNVFPRRGLLAQGRRMAGMEILRIGGHEPDKQHLARRSRTDGIHNTMPKLPAMGKARQRLPRLSACARPMEKRHTELAHAV